MTFGELVFEIRSQTFGPLVRFLVLLVILSFVCVFAIVWSTLVLLSQNSGNLDFLGLCGLFEYVLQQAVSLFIKG